MHRWLRDFALDYLIPDIPALSREELWRSIMTALIGLLVATALASYLPAPLGNRWLIAPIGASAMILFSLPHSPLAQPWSVFGGYFFAALSAAICRAILPEHPPLAAAFAVAMCIGLMGWMRCMHPPGGALAFILAFSPETGWNTALRTFAEVGLDACFLMIAALLANNLIFRRRYPYCRAKPPVNTHRTKDQPPTARLGLTHVDLQAALQKMDTYVDVQEADLVDIYNLATDHAFSRHVAMTCGDIMAQDVVSIEFATPLEEAWNTLRAHKIKALPVVERGSGRLLGILTVADFLKQIDATRATSMAGKIQGLLRASPGTTSEKAEVVGQIMTKNPYCVTPELPILDLVRRLSDHGMHHVPVVNSQHCVIGMTTQSDLIAALYKQISLTQAATSSS